MGMKKRSIPTRAPNTSTHESDTENPATQNRGRRTTTARTSLAYKDLGLPVNLKLAGIVAYLHTALQIFLAYCSQLDQIRISYLEDMGLTSWFSGERVDSEHESGHGDEEMKEMKTKAAPKAVVKRRRHQGSKGESAFCSFSGTGLIV